MTKRTTKKKEVALVLSMRGRGKKGWQKCLVLVVGGRIDHSQEGPRKGKEKETVMD